MGENRTVEATWSELGGGESRWFLGTLATIRVSGEAVDGRFALIETIDAGFSIRIHGARLPLIRSR